VKVFVSYAHDGEGDAHAEWLVNELRVAGCDVCWDGDLASVNPSSIQEWMERQVSDSIVVCIVTPQYAERFGSGSDSSSRKGVLYESRAIELRLHDHTPAGDCPVIPVVADDYSTTGLPSTLRRLLATRISQSDNSGIDELLTRIRALSHTVANMIRRPEPIMTEGSSPLKYDAVEASLRDILSELELVQRGTIVAMSAVNQWLNLAESTPAGVPPLFAAGFPDAENIAKSTGDLNLMRRISNASLVAVRSSTPRLRSDLQMEARVLVCGEGWYLQRSNQLQAALDSTRLGVNIAKRVGDRRTEAFGKKCLGRLERLMAEEQSDSVLAQPHLEQSQSLLTDAREMFIAIDGSDSDEAGDCLSLEGRTWLTYYRIAGSSEYLSRAKECAMRAGELIPPNNSKDYWDLVILNGELESEERRFADASRLLQQAIDRLNNNPDGPRSEILARALRAHATVVEQWHPRSGATQVLRDLEAAEAIYQKLEQEHAAFECYWRQIVINPSKVTKLQLGRRELDELAKQEPNTKLRIDAIRELEAQEDARIGVSIGRRLKSVNWTAILRRVRTSNRQSES